MVHAFSKRKSASLKSLLRSVPPKSNSGSQGDQNKRMQKLEICKKKKNEIIHAAILNFLSSSQLNCFQNRRIARSIKTCDGEVGKEAKIGFFKSMHHSEL